eukprot:3159662-Amphidinium_carterae.1
MPPGSWTLAAALEVKGPPRALLHHYFISYVLCMRELVQLLHVRPTRGALLKQRPAEEQFYLDFCWVVRAQSRTRMHDADDSQVGEADF